MNVIDTEIAGVKIIEPRVFGDARGYFFESFSVRDFAAQTGIEATFVQDNESKSRYGVLRGLHFQNFAFIWMQSNTRNYFSFKCKRFRFYYN